MAAATAAKMPTPAKADYSLAAGATGGQGLSASAAGQGFTGTGGQGLRLR